MRKTWTPERTEFLRANWGRITAREIAEGLGHGITRNAILGKADRMGLPPSSFGPNPIKERKRTDVIKIIQTLVPIITPDTAVPLAECTGCRFAFGDGRSEPYTFCNERIYAKWMCEGHYILCHQRDQRPLKLRLASGLANTDNKLDELQGLER